MTTPKHPPRRVIQVGARNISGAMALSLGEEFYKPEEYDLYLSFQEHEHLLTEKDREIAELKEERANIIRLGQIQIGKRIMQDQQLAEERRKVETLRDHIAKALTYADLCPRARDRLFAALAATQEK